MYQILLHIWVEVNDLSGGQYSTINNIMYKTPMLISDLCGYGVAYIVLKERISITGNNNAI